MIIISIFNINLTSLVCHHHTSIDEIQKVVELFDPHSHLLEDLQLLTNTFHEQDYIFFFGLQKDIGRNLA